MGYIEESLVANYSRTSAIQMHCGRRFLGMFIIERKLNFIKFYSFCYSDSLSLPIPEVLLYFHIIAYDHIPPLNVTYRHFMCQT